MSKYRCLHVIFFAGLVLSLAGLVRDSAHARPLAPDERVAARGGGTKQCIKTYSTTCPGQQATCNLNKTTNICEQCKKHTSFKSFESCEKIDDAAYNCDVTIGKDPSFCGEVYVKTPDMGNCPGAAGCTQKTQSLYCGLAYPSSITGTPCPP